MLGIKLLKIKHFFLFQTVLAMIMVTQIMVIQNSRTYFSSKETIQRQFITRAKEVEPLPMCPEKSQLLVGQIFIHRGINKRGMVVLKHVKK